VQRGADRAEKTPHIILREGFPVTNHIKDFILHLESRDRSSHTTQAYRLDLQQFEKWFAGVNGDEMEPELITPTDLREFKHFLIEEEQLKPATINRKLASLRAFLKWAVGEGTIESVPRMPQGVEQVSSAPKALDRREMNSLSRAVERHGSKRDHAIILVLLNTGLRVNELSELNLADVEMTERKGKVVVRSGKGQKYREVPLNAEARRALLAYMEARKEDRDSALFLSQQGSRLGSRGVQDVVGKYGRLAGLEDLTPHALRHTFCTNLLRAGTDIVTVAKLAGHADISTTSIYTQPAEKDLQKAVEGLVE
jgi:site-specific recombinase XerD